MLLRSPCLWLVLAAAALFAPSRAFAADRVTEWKAKFPPCTKTASKEDEEAAKHAHRAALEGFERKDFEMASRLWSDAYRFDCSRPRVFLNLGSAFEQAGDAHAALAVYELFQERASEDAPADLPPKLHDLRMKVKKLDDSAAKAAVVVPRDVPPSPQAVVETEKPLGVVPWIIVGGGGAVAVAGGALLGVGLSQAGSAADECADPEARTGCSQDAADRGESGELMSQIGQGLLYGGVGIAALGIILEFAANGEDPVAKESAFFLVPQLGPQSAGVLAGGTF